MESFAGYRLILNMHYIDKLGFTNVMGPISTGVQLTTNIEVGRTTGEVAIRTHLPEARHGWFADSSRVQSTFNHGRVTFAEEECEMIPMATSSGTGSQTRPRIPTAAQASNV